MSMEKDVHTLRNVALCVVGLWVALFVIAFGSYLWSKYKAAQEAADADASSSSSTPKVALSSVKL